MPICNKCKQNAHFTVKDSLQICGRCGATTTIAKLQTEDFKGLKYQKHYISEKRVKRVAEEKSVTKHIEDNWGAYLEAFQRALRESIQLVSEKLDLDEAFELKAKQIWFEYLQVFRENKLPLIGFFTTPRQGNPASAKSAEPTLIHSYSRGFESRYRQRRTHNTMHFSQQIDDNDIHRQEISIDQGNDYYETDFVEKILKQKNTQDQEAKIISENSDIGDIFKLFEDVYSIVPTSATATTTATATSSTTKDRHSQHTQGAFTSNLFTDRSLENILGNAEAKKNTPFSSGIQTRKSSAQLQQNNMMNKEMQQYTDQVQEQVEQLELKRKKKRRAKGKLNYIENPEERGKNYFSLMLERSEEYVKQLYNGFRSAYLHMLYLQEPEPNPLKKIKKIKDSSKGYSITKDFVLRQIDKRRIVFARDFSKVDIFHLIWAYDWAEFVSANSTFPFVQKDTVNGSMQSDDYGQLYAYLDKVSVMLAKQLKEHQTIQAELAKSKMLLNRSKKLMEIKMKLLARGKAKRRVKNNQVIHEGYLSGDDYDNDLLETLEVEERRQTAKRKVSTPRMGPSATPRVPRGGKGSHGTAAELVEQLDLNSSMTMTREMKSDERVDQEKITEELQYQQDRFNAKKMFAFDEDQMLTLQVVIEEILKERDLLAKRRNQMPLFRKKIKATLILEEIEEQQQAEQESNPSGLLVPLEYNLIPTIIYVSLHSIGEAYMPSDIHHWMKSGLFAFNLGISPYIKIADAKRYWLTPPSIPSSDFIRLNAKKLMVMTEQKMRKKELKQLYFSHCLRIVSDFGFPIEWAAMMYLIAVRGFLRKPKSSDKKDDDDEDDKDQFGLQCDVKVGATLIMLLKMVYGLNDQMFSVFLNEELIDDAKDVVNEAQHGILVNALKQLEQRSSFKRMSAFYSTIPSLKQVVVNVTNFLARDKEESMLEVHDYKQMSSISSQGVLLLLASFIDKRKRATVLSKIKQASYSMSQQTVQMQYDDLEDDIPFVRAMRNHVLKDKITSSLDEDLFFSQSLFGNVGKSAGSGSSGSQDAKVTVEMKKEYQFMVKRRGVSQNEDQLVQDLEYVANDVIRKGQQLHLPSYEYSIEKKLISGGTGLSNELEFVVKKLSEYFGYPEKTEKLLSWVFKLESRIHALVIKNTKKVQTAESNNDFISLISKSVAREKTRKNPEVQR